MDKATEENFRGIYPIWASRRTFEIAISQWIEALGRLVAEVTRGEFDLARRDQEQIDRSTIYAIESAKSWVKAVSPPARHRSRAQSAALRALK
jgi:hypothetical protein